MRIPPKLFPQTFSVTRCITGDGFGGCAEFSDPIVFSARFDDQRKLIRDAGGNEVVSGTTVYLPGDADIRLTGNPDDNPDRVVLPENIEDHLILEVIKHAGRYGEIVLTQVEVA